MGYPGCFNPRHFRENGLDYQGKPFGRQVFTAPLLVPQTMSSITVWLAKYPLCAVTGSENRDGTLNSPLGR